MWPNSDRKDPQNDPQNDPEKRPKMGSKKGGAALLVNHLKRSKTQVMNAGVM